jgi:hypothetical protein
MEITELDLEESYFQADLHLADRGAIVYRLQYP